MTNFQLSALPAQARVWVYQAHEPFLTESIPDIQQHLQQFTQQWVSHNRALRAVGQVVENRFVVLAVDESQAGASGCSIDSSVAFLKKLGNAYQRDLFDRMRFSYVEADGTVETVGKEEFAARYAAGQISDDTIVFDPLVKDMGEWRTAFRKRLADSWHARFV
jgi:hypothetical protein